MHLDNAADVKSRRQKDLDKLSMWESQWDMEFNPSNCQMVRVTTARKAINSVYTLHDQILEVVASARYFFVCFLCFTSKVNSYGLVIAERSVHLTTLFLGHA